MDNSKFKDVYSELERIHNRIIQTEQEIQNIDTTLNITREQLNSYEFSNVVVLKRDSDSE